MIQNSEVRRLMVSLARELLLQADLIARLRDVKDPAEFNAECNAEIERSNNLYSEVRALLLVASSSTFKPLDAAFNISETRRLQLQIEELEVRVAHSTIEEQKCKKYKRYATECTETCEKLSADLESSRDECAMLRKMLEQERIASSCEEITSTSPNAQRKEFQVVTVQADDHISNISDNCSAEAQQSPSDDKQQEISTDKVAAASDLKSP